MIKKHIWLIGVLLLLLLVLLAAVSIPLLMGDGSQQYTGNQQSAAKSAVEFANSISTGIDRINHLETLQFHADSVVPDNPSKAGSDTVCNNELAVAAIPGVTDRYLVAVSSRTVFGITARVDAYHICLTNT